MTDREKIIELLNKAHDGFYCANFDPKRSYMGWMADFLIANGVTFAKWKPIGDVPPKGECLAFSAENKRMLSGFIEPNENCTSGFLCSQDFDALLDVTHWMPLPEPPKEEGV